jgi:hypothetical protein
MSGQQQILVLNQESLFEKFAKENLRQADLYYAEKKFKVGEGMDELKALHSYILKDVLCEDDCEIVNFLYKRITGQLECSKRRKNKSVLKHIEDNDNITVINNYYTQPFEWTETPSW